MQQNTAHCYLIPITTIVPFMDCIIRWRLIFKPAMPERTKQFFYTSVCYALLSVAFIICCIFCYETHVEHAVAMEVYWYKEGQNKFWQPPPQRKYVDITFTGDTAADRIKLNLGQLYIRGMLHSKDTIHGINFHFSDHARYASLVAVLDVCNIEDAHTYAPSDDGIKVYYYEFHKKIAKPGKKRLRKPIELHL